MATVEASQHRPVAERFRDVRLAHRAIAVQIRYGSRHSQNPMIRPGGEAQSLGGIRQ